MAAQNQIPNNTDLFDAYFRKADLDGDGQISGAEAVAFSQGSNLPKHILAQIWGHADQKKLGYLSRQEFYNFLKLVTVAQSKRDLTPDMVKAALYGPASAKIPAPQINLAAGPTPQSKIATPTPQSSGNPAVPSQSFGFQGTPGFGNVGVNQQYFQSQQNQVMRPPQAMPSSTSSQAQQVTGQGMPRGGNMVAPRLPTSNSSTNWQSGSSGSLTAGGNNQVHNHVIGPPTSQDGSGFTAQGLTPSIQPRPQATTGQMSSTTSKPQDSSIPSSQLAAKDPKALVVSGNGFAPDTLFGDVFSATQSQSKQTSLVTTSSATSSTVSTASIPASGLYSSVKPSTAESFPSTLSQQPVGGQYQSGHPTGKQNQQVTGQSNTASGSTGVPVGAGNFASSHSTQSQSQSPWPKMTQSDIQKYTKVFVQVDTDRDGKITGEQARNLFLSWSLPRVVLKQVWDLSDQDNDSMLSLKEFCTALYLMERYREGRPLPSVLPSSVISDENLLSTSGHRAAPYGNAAWGPAHGFQQPQVVAGSRPPLPSAKGRPPRPVSVSQIDAHAQVQPAQQKSKVPVLEKNFVDQLSQEEQDSLNSKFKEATEANKKALLFSLTSPPPKSKKKLATFSPVLICSLLDAVEELEKEIQDSKAKTEFFRAKMQELILYKSRCDSRLNEITERVSADKREVEALARKYEEKFRQTGDVASRLTIEESTFRDIQERKMELYQAIVRIEQGDNKDGSLQDRANQIQSGLEELVKSVNERCKQYGLRAKPTSLVELPFGWQAGIQEGAADWDEDWDNFEGEGFTFVKELTLDVQNVIAPPKPKSSSVQKETASATASVANSDKVQSASEQMPEKDLANDRSEDCLPRSPSESPGVRSTADKQSQEFQDSHVTKSTAADGSPHAQKTSDPYESPHAKKTSDADGSPVAKESSDHGGAESIFSEERNFDEPSWGKFDNQDTDSVWGFDSEIGKEMDHERHDDNPLFGLGDFNIKPIRTQSSHSDNMFPGKGPFTFADSVPSTPSYTDNMFYGKSSSNFVDSVPSTPAYTDNLFKGKSSSIFADSVPSTPAYSDSMFKGQGSSIFADSVPSTPAYADNMFKGKSSSIFADSVPSTPAYNYGSSQRRFSEGSEDHSFDSFSRFDSFNMQDSGFFQTPSLDRFDSVRSSRDSDQGYGFPPLRFDSFNAHDGHDGGVVQSPQHSLARFDSIRSTTGFDHSHEFPSFDDTDPFGSTGPFRTSLESQTPRRDSDNWSAF
ncbi:hypothetical protein COLO4_22557 [Corchorus olitorius]|uniref:Calcium-binding EF-hand n=1 Tax=Corchorus olitorius TaxID=93759 RepID=A0A1R3ILB0_9ROSI|nr:hypothetical protein COLO4_22557 [Corchorus olitorius]